MKLIGMKHARKISGLTYRKIAESLLVEIRTVQNWENQTSYPKGQTLKALANLLNTTESELLNGPGEVEYRVTLKYVKTLEGVNEEMNMNGIALTIAEDGFVGVSGGKKFETREDIDAVVENIRRKLTFGFEHRDEIKGAKE